MVAEILISAASLAAMGWLLGCYAESVSEATDAMRHEETGVDIHAIPAE